MKKILLTIFFLLQVSVVKAATVAPTGQECGAVSADIVIMIDRTGSVETDKLAAEKVAANALVQKFSDLGLSHKVAVGVFPDIQTDGRRTFDTADDASVHRYRAKLISGLTNSYAGLQTLIMSDDETTGVGDNTEGGTNIESALSVARAELNNNGTNPLQYIILISDGMTNYSENTTSDVDTARTDATAQADGAKNDDGIKIITIAYDNDGADSDADKANLERQALNDLAAWASDSVNNTSDDVDSTEQAAENSADDGDNFFIAPAAEDIGVIFDSIGDIISCDDGNPCTADTCNEQTNTCSSVIAPSGVDTDQDGVDNCSDVCANAPDVDTDNDGILDCNDECDNNSTDTDGDGTADCNETCDNDPTKTSPGYCGCGTVDSYVGDYPYPTCDYCPEDDNKLYPGACGCGNRDIYVDESEEPICEVDECPDDELKSAPGICGCGVADDDLNENDIPDCNETDDACPDDELKSEPGICGCGVADVDADADEIVDCVDECPGDALNDANDNGICDGDEEGNPDTTPTPPAPAIVPAPALNQVQGSGSSCSLNTNAASAHDVSFALMAMAMMGMVVVRRRMN